MMGVCRYCGCTETTPCVISFPFSGRQHIRPCSWLLPDVCDAPVCVEKAYMDARNSAEELDRLLEEGITIEFEQGVIA